MGLLRLQDGWSSIKPKQRKESIARSVTHLQGKHLPFMLSAPVKPSACDSRQPPKCSLTSVVAQSQRGGLFVMMWWEEQRLRPGAALFCMIDRPSLVWLMLISFFFFFFSVCIFYGVCDTCAGRWRDQVCADVVNVITAGGANHCRHWCSLWPVLPVLPTPTRPLHRHHHHLNHHLYLRHSVHHCHHVIYLQLACICYYVTGLSHPSCYEDSVLLL